MKHLRTISKIPATAQTAVSPTGLKLMFIADFLGLLVPVVDAKWLADNPS
jgi:hypothetical protein